jgi:putative multiple sugar transport system permease protein
LSQRNLSNLLNQTGYIAVLAVGMTLVIIIRHIDLSVGFLAGFLGAVAAIALSRWGMSVYLVIPLVLALGAVAGLITAFPVAQLGIPSFVASLAGWLIYRGFLQLVTEGTGTIIISNAAFNAIGNAFIPDIPNIGFLSGVHKLTLLLGILAIILFIVSGSMVAARSWPITSKSKADGNLCAQAAVRVGGVGGFTWVLASYQGLVDGGDYIGGDGHLPLYHHADGARAAYLRGWQIPMRPS